MVMIIERTEDEVIFRLPADTDITSLQRILDYLKIQGSDQQKSRHRRTGARIGTRIKSQVVGRKQGKIY